METFASWFDLLTYLESHTIVHYKAPLDLYPVPVVVTKKFKNGKLRIKWAHGSFTADIGHRQRFMRKVD